MFCPDNVYRGPAAACLPSAAPERHWAWVSSSSGEKFCHRPQCFLTSPHLLEQREWDKMLCLLPPGSVPLRKSTFSDSCCKQEEPAGFCKSIALWGKRISFLLKDSATTLGYGVLPQTKHGRDGCWGPLAWGWQQGDFSGVRQGRHGVLPGWI